MTKIQPGKEYRVRSGLYTGDILTVSNNQLGPGFGTVYYSKLLKQDIQIPTGIRIEEK